MTHRVIVAALAAAGFVLGGWERAFGQASGVANVYFEWTDRLGNTHPLKFTWTVGFEDDGIFGLEPAGTGFTNSLGVNVFTGTDLTPFDSQTEFRGNVQGFLGTAAGVGPYWAKIGPTTAGVYAQDWPLPSGTTYNVPDPPGSASFTYTVDNTTVAGVALGMMQAVDFIGRYYRDAHGLTVPTIDVVWNSGIAGSAYFANPPFAEERIEIGATDWASWDVIMHEFGHFIARHNNYSAYVGGAHNFGQETINIADPEPGAQLSWSEGVATFLGLLAVHDGNLNAAIPGLPGKDVDAFYDSFITPFNDSTQPENTNIGHRISAESKGGANDTGASGPNLGEGDEMSVLRVLWDVYDSNADAFASGSDKANWGASDTLDLISGVETFKDFWDNLAAAALADPSKVGLANGDPEPLILGRLGEILEEYAVAMQPIVDFLQTADTTPTLRFNEQNNDRSSKLRVIVWNDDFSMIVDDFTGDDTVGLTLWSYEVANALTVGETYHWAVLNNSAMHEGAEPGTLREWYWSSIHTFEVVPEASTVVLCAMGGAAVIGLAFRRRQRGA